MDEPLNRTECKAMAVARLQAADGELGQDELSAMQAHLERCPACRKEQEYFEIVERQLVACGEATDLQRATRGAPVRRRWVEAAVAVAALIALAIWLPPWQRQVSRALPSSALQGGETGLSDGTETIRVELPLSPVSSPFLDGLQSGPAVSVNVVIGADGLPVDVRLASE